VTKLLRALLAALVLVLLFPTNAAAHPLGNFTINQYSRLELGRETVQLRYIVDMAEIPAFQELRGMDQNGSGAVEDDEKQTYLTRVAPELINNLQLREGESALALRTVAQEISTPVGQGGLLTLRIVLDLEATRITADSERPFSYRSDNYVNRLGWREIIAVPLAGVDLRDSTAATEDRSDQLRNYPTDLLATPLDMREATLIVAPGAASTSQPTQPVNVPGVRADDPFTALISERELTPSFMFVALGLALALGAAHALSPGHGKTVVAAYMVGSRGTPWHALILGLTTTITHTAGVFLLGFATLLLSNYILPEQILPWLELLSGGLIVVIGIALLRTRLKALLSRPQSAGHTHDHDHDHDHNHSHSWEDHEHGPHTHTHAPPPGKITLGSLIALGVSGGLLPCPSALVVLLGAIALNRVGFGMILIVAFSLGMSAVLTGIGLLLVYARKLFERLPTRGTLVRVLPVFSAVVVTLVGAAISAAALSRAGIL
jgi:ABC-type nickel/cobalt efflux system permease component RcnA